VWLPFKTKGKVPYDVDPKIRVTVKGCNHILKSVTCRDNKAQKALQEKGSFVIELSWNKQTTNTVTCTQPWVHAKMELVKTRRNSQYIILVCDVQTIIYFGDTAAFPWDRKCHKYGSCTCSSSADCKERRQRMWHNCSCVRITLKKLTRCHTRIGTTPINGPRRTSCLQILSIPVIAERTSLPRWSSKVWLFDVLCQMTVTCI
jgi:hypothetical protein